MYIRNDYILGPSILRCACIKQNFKKSNVSVWYNVDIGPIGRCLLITKILAMHFVKIFDIYILILVKKKILAETLNV